MTQEIEDFLYNIINNEGESTQLDATIYLLNGLMEWCNLCFNNKQEEEDYKLLEQAYDLLKQVQEHYKTLY